MVDLSVVIPIRNEAASLAELVRELTETLTRWDRAYEIIVVDDGSTDDSFETLSRMQSLDSRLRVIRFRRNFGQTAAFAAGFDHARGRVHVQARVLARPAKRNVVGDPSIRVVHPVHFLEMHRHERLLERPRR